MNQYQPSTTRAGDRDRSGLVNAILGAIVMTVFSWIPFAPVVGGGLAGYLEAAEPSQDRSASSRALRVGAIAGLIATVPAILVVLLVASVFTFGFIGVGLGGMGDPAMGPGIALGLPIFAWLFVLFGVVAFAAYHVALGAIGGWLGAQLADRDDRASNATRRTDQRTLDEPYDGDDVRTESDHVRTDTDSDHATTVGSDADESGRDVEDVERSRDPDRQ